MNFIALNKGTPNMTTTHDYDPDDKDPLPQKEENPHVGNC